VFYKDRCLNCGRQTDVRNNRICSRICEGEYENKSRMSGQNVVKDVLEGLPTFEQLRQNPSIRQVKNDRQEILKNQKLRHLARLKMHEERIAQSQA